jgi:hypothetical protein
VVHTNNRGGTTLRKRFIVKTNDPQHPTFTLVVKGSVRAYIPLTPNRIQLRGRVGEQVQKTVHIERLKAYPFHVKAVKAKDGRNLRFELKPGNPGKDGYQLVVTNTMQKAGSYRDMITIETDSKVKPTLRIPITARILAAAK